jgi:rhodanese-related sulfurtransferase
MQHSPGFLKLIEDSKKNVRELTIQQVVDKRKRGDKFHFIDVREDLEWAAGHAEGAVHLGRGILERDIEGALPDKNAEIVLYCGGGFRSALSAESIQKMGYRNVFSMDGGFRGWKEAGLPITKP